MTQNTIFSSQVVPLKDGSSDVSLKFSATAPKIMASYGHNPPRPPRATTATRGGVLTPWALGWFSGRGGSGGLNRKRVVMAMTAEDNGEVFDASKLKKEEYTVREEVDADSIDKKLKLNTGDDEIVETLVKTAKTGMGFAGAFVND